MPLEVVAALLLHGADPRRRSETGLKPGYMISTSTEVGALLDLFQGKRPEEEWMEAALGALSQPLRRRVAEHLASRAQAPAAEEKPATPWRARPGPVPPAPAAAAQAARAPAPQARPRSAGTLKRRSLREAAETDDLALLLELLEAKADPNVGDEEGGETPLSEAAAGGDPDVVAALLAHSGDPNIVCRGVKLRDLTPGVAVAARTLLDLFGPQEVEMAREIAALEEVRPDLRLEVLLRLEAMDSASGAVTTRGGAPEQPPAAEGPGPAEEEPLAPQPAARRADRTPALWSAVERGDLPLVLELLEAKADPNEADVTGEVPLHEAANNGDPDLVAALLAHSADHNILGLGQQRPRDLLDLTPGVAVAARTLLDLFEGREVEMSREIAALEEVRPDLRLKVLLCLEAMDDEPPAAGHGPAAAKATAERRADEAVPEEGSEDGMPQEVAKGAAPAVATEPPGAAAAASRLESAGRTSAAAGVAGPASAEAEASHPESAGAPAAEAKEAAAPGAPAEETAFQGDTLLRAVQTRDLPGLARLLRARADPNSCGADGETVLFEAATKSMFTLVPS